MKIRLIISIILLSILIFIVQKAVNLDQLPQMLLSFPKQDLVYLASLSFIISILKAWRFLIILRNTDIKVSFWEVIKTSIAGGAITPLPGGEAIRAVLLKHEAGVKPKAATGPIITQAYLEVFSSTILMVIGSLIFKDFLAPALFTLILVSFAGSLFIFPKLSNLLLTILPKWSFIKNTLTKLNKVQKVVRENFIDLDTNLPDKVLVISLGISFVSNLLGGLLVFLVAKSFGVELNFLLCIFVYAASIVISAIGTISPGGLGLTEGGITAILLLSKITLAKAISIVIMFRVMTLVFNILIGIIFILCFYSKPLILKREATT